MPRSLANTGRTDRSMPPPVISIVTPTFDRAALLPRLWRSMRGESVPFEWIVVDDASTDLTPSVVRGIGDPRIVFARLDRNRGQNAARNAGVRLARGRFIVFIDSDDELAVNALQGAVTAIENAPPAVGAVLMMAVPAFSNSRVELIPDASVLTEEDLVIRRLLRGDRAVIYKREVFRNQMLPEEYHACEHVFVLGISRWWSYLVVNRPLTLVNREGDHSCSAANIVRRSADIAASWETVIANHAVALRGHPPARAGLYMTVLYRYGVAAQWNPLRRVFLELRRSDPGCATAIKAACVVLAGLLGHLGAEYWRLKFMGWQITYGGNRK
jgi:glycosyltransferase involved in cell wall biosynthesis